jgi:GTP-binding protein
VNKWDLAGARGLTPRVFQQQAQERLKFLAHAPLVFVSARTGRGVAELLKAAARVHEAQRTRVTTGEFNRMLARASERHAPKADKGNREVKILFGSQVGVAPPTFVLWINHPVGLHFSYKRFLENQIRGAFGFEGTPLVLLVRARRH